MRRFFGPLAAVTFGLLVAVLSPATTNEDVDGSKDHPLFNRLPNYHIDNYDASNWSNGRELK